jgi:hypothetical protein
MQHNSSPFLDILPIIASNLPYKHKFAIANTCKQIYNEIMGKWSGIVLGPYTMRPYQYMLCDRANALLEQVQKVTISAPMGAGKTLTSIYFIMSFYKSKNVLICSPPPALKVWIAELTKVGLLQSKVDKTDVLVVHSTRPKHNAHHTSCTNVFETHRIVLTTDNMANKIKGKPDLLVRDETHKAVKAGLGVVYYNDNFKVLGLTAEDVESGFNHKVLKLIDNNFDEKIPKINYNFHTINNDKVGAYGRRNVHIDDVFENEEDYKNVLIEVVKSKLKVVMFLDKGNIGTAVREWITDYLPEYKVFELLSTDKTLQSFHNYKKNAILFVGSSNNEGLNIFEENIVLFKPDMMAATRIKQSIGRLRRPGNKYGMVNCDIIVGSRIAMLKSFYSACYAEQSWTFGFEDSPNQDFLLKCAGIIGLMGYSDFLTFPLPDACVIFDNVHTRERYDEVSQWWLKHKTTDSVLTLDHINALYI